MKEKKIAVIGVGGRTGTMFAFELKKASNVLGIGREIKRIKEKKLFIEKKRNSPEVFEGRVITDSQFPSDEFLPEIIFLTTRNPVGPVIKYYYQKIKERRLPLPTLILSQNGIAVSKEALSALKEVLGLAHQKVRVVRMNLFNPIDRKEINNKIYINYSLPIRIVLGKISGPGELQDITSLFKKAGFEAKEFPTEEVKNMEFSKLFLNLIGIASATRGLTLNQGFKDKETFIEEIGALKEYIKAVRTSGGKFFNFSHCPVRLLTSLLKGLPIRIFLPFRNYFAKMISKEREGKPKDLAEIEYYTGAVVDLGKETGIPTPINQKIFKRVSGFNN